MKKKRFTEQQIIGSVKEAEAGVPLNALQELGGWESVEMVRRYAHFSNEHLAGYVQRFSGLRLVDGGQRTYDFPTLPAPIEGEVLPSA
jgi:hypothetical protein